jgi:hypothetical protein
MMGYSHASSEQLGRYVSIVVQYCPSRAIHTQPQPTRRDRIATL